MSVGWGFSTTFIKCLQKHDGTLLWELDWWTLSEYTTREQEVEHENIVIVALLHDLCKVDFL